MQIKIHNKSTIIKFDNGALYDLNVNILICVLSTTQWHIPHIPLMLQIGHYRP